MENLIRRVATRLLGWSVGAIVTGLVVLAFTQVVLRYAFDASILWVEEISVMALIWLAWIGVTHLWLSGSHIAVDLLASRLSPPGRARLAALLDGLALVLGLALAFVSLDTLAIYSGMELGSLEMDASIKYLPITAGGIGLALAGLLNLVRAALGRAPAS